MPRNGPRARALAGRLRQARVEHGLTVRQLAEMARIPHGNISKYENGHAVPAIEQVATIVTAAGVSSEERDEILEIARDAHKRDWLTAGIHGLPAQLTGAMECERAACHIIEWVPFGVPGLLRTTDYSRALNRIGGLSDEENDKRIMAQSLRQELIGRIDGPITFDAYIGEGMFSTRIGSPLVVAEQLRHLGKMTQRTNIIIRIIPLESEWHPGVTGPFIFYQFSDATPIVYFEHHSSGAFVHDDHDINEYYRAIEWLDRIALSQDETMALIIKRASILGESSG